MKCNQKKPGFCNDCNRKVRWVEIQTCNWPNESYQSRETGKILKYDCLSCIFSGEILKDAEGIPIGKRGCGCTSQSVPTGNTWITCNKTQTPVLITKATRCQSYRSKYE